METSTAFRRQTRYSFDVDQIKAWYADGASIREIGRRLDVSMKTVHRHMMAASIPRREPGPVTKNLITKTERRAIRAALQAGEAPENVAEQFGRRLDTMLAMRPRPPRPPRPTRADQAAKVRDLYSQGLRGVQIDAALGWKRGRAGAHQRRMGLDPQPAMPSVAELADLYRSLGSVQAVADHIGKPPHRVRAMLKEAGPLVRVRPPHPLDEHADAIRRAYTDEGLPITELAARFGCSYTTMHGFMNREDITLYRHITAEQHDQMVRLAAGGAPVKQIAEMYGVAPITVKKHLRDQPQRRFGPPLPRKPAA